MSTILLTKHKIAGIIVLIMSIILSFSVYAQEPEYIDSAAATNVQDTILMDFSYVADIPDSLANDSIPLNDSRKQISQNAITAKIDYTAKDSINIDLKQQIVFLYKDAEINYQDINLTAGYIEINFKKNLLYATGIIDSTGYEIQRPVFSQDNQSFTAKTILYNFTTKKGLIKDIITKEGDSYLHGSIVKRFPDNSTNVKDGKYTTCPSEHPHYEIRFYKARVIPDDKIVTGPAYLVIEDVPTPLIVPFGFFPNKKGQLSGILLPTYGSSANRGFYFENGGYYWGINDYVDLALRGDIYTRGSWAARVISNYKKRYKYSGMINLNYAENYFGERELPDFHTEKTFFIRWQHKQDPKARPNSTFSANVNAGSSNYNKYNSTSSNDYLSNDFESSIAYQTSFFRGSWNLSTNMGYKQNTSTKEVMLRAPEMSLSVNRFYPFRKKSKTKLSWYDNISVSYVLNAQNKINTPDSMLLTRQSLEKLQNGIQHTIPVSANMKVLKYFSWNNTVSFTDRNYFQTIDKHLERTSDSLWVETDTINKFTQAFDFNLSSSLNTKLYGMFKFRRGPIKAIRHVLTPSASITYRPDFGTEKWGYYKYTDIDTIGNTQKYSIFENGIYGGPADGKSGKVSMALTNNLEMKVRSRKDTVNGVKKVMLIENLTIRCGYDIAKDSLNWDYLNVTGRTKLFRKIDVTYSGMWDPYAADSAGNRINEFEWEVNDRLFRLNSYQWTLSASFYLSHKDFNSKKDDDDSPPDQGAHPVPVVDYSNPWSLNLSYNLTYANRFYTSSNSYIKDTVQTLNISGDISITKKWKFGFTTGYDFDNKDFSYTSVNVYRDLHCWEMVFNWIPMGFRKSYNFTIRVKSSILQDLKLTKKTDWRDNY